MKKEQLKLRSIRVEVSYPAKVYFEDDDVDNRVEKLFGIEVAGSGMGFGKRDLEFEATTPKQVEKLLKAIGKLQKLGWKV